MTRYVFIVEDLHLLLLAGLPAHYQPPLTLTLMRSSSSGSTRGSVASGIVFDEESRGVADRDARVEPGRAGP